MEIGRMDSRELHVSFLFNEIEIGHAFVRSASQITDAAARAQTLMFAQNAHDTIVRSVPNTPLTAAEGERLHSALFDLQCAITACEERFAI